MEIGRSQDGDEVHFNNRTVAMHIETVMNGNQSFNQSLYVPLTLAPLPCRPKVHLLKDGVHEA
jgi:hypothetical protein